MGLTKEPRRSRLPVGPLAASVLAGRLPVSETRAPRIDWRLPLAARLSSSGELLVALLRLHMGGSSLRSERRVVHLSRVERSPPIPGDVGGLRHQLHPVFDRVAARGLRRHRRRTRRPRGVPAGLDTDGNAPIFLP